jgi:hypothetical protein
MATPSEGFNAVFSGAMGADVARPCDMQVIEAATFTTLELQFTSNQTGQAAATAPIYPALFVFENVKKFRLASGSVAVAFSK